MNPFAPKTRKFISAVRRRILVIRIAESVAIASAISSAAGLALMPILWWRGQSGLPLAIFSLILGIFCGLIWGISRRPTHFQAAIEADQQLGLHDLLATILLLTRDPAPNTWSQSIAAIADRQCQSLSPGAIVVNRLGLRGWSGVGVLGALLITLGLFTTRPIDVSAAAPGNTDLAQQQPIQSSIAIADETQQPTARPPGPGGTDDNSTHQYQQNRPDSSPTEATSSQSHSPSTATNSIGSGSATTPPSNLTNHPPISPDSPTDRTSHFGPTAPGTGQSDPRASAAGAANTITASSTNTIHQTPPWSSDQWQTDAAAAQNAITAGQVPDSDADLVRDYFKRD